MSDECTRSKDLGESAREPGGVKIAIAAFRPFRRVATRQLRGPVTEREPKSQMRSLCLGIGLLVGEARPFFGMGEPPPDTPFQAQRSS